MKYKVLAQKIHARSVLVINLKEGGHLENLVIGGGIILKWTLKQYDGMAWAEFIWLRRGISGGLLWKE